MAEADVETIFEHIRPRSPEGAVSWYKAFQAAAHRTVQMPEPFPLAAEHSCKTRHG